MFMTGVLCTVCGAHVYFILFLFYRFPMSQFLLSHPDYCDISNMNIESIYDKIQPTFLWHF